MTGEEYDKIIAEVESLPSGGITYKKINGKEYASLYNYVYGDIHDRVHILYGLRRTGKTTLIRQLISEMDVDMRAKSAFIQIQESKTLADVNHDLRILETRGYRYIFIDEVTLLDDFIQGAVLFSDIFAASGMNMLIVLLRVIFSTR